jgi:signal transduction histidine kinase
MDRTLDEMYYPGLSADDLVKRNADQVVSRKFRNSEMPDERIPILIVLQLWFWSIGKFMISAYSRTGDLVVDQAQNDRNGEWRDQEGSLIAWTRYPPLQYRLIIASYIESFGKESYVGSERFLPILDIFKNEVVAALSDVDKYIDETKPSSVDYKKERNFLHVLSDIRSKLVIVLYVLEQQKKVLKDLINDEPIDEFRYRDWAPVRRAESSLARYEGRIKKIDGDTERIEKAVNDILNLKRIYASIKDTYSSLLLSTAVIGFTVITIVFAPLAFLTALFALKIDGFEKLQVNGSDPNSVYKSSYMGGIFSRYSLVRIVPASISINFYYSQFRDRNDSLDCSHCCGIAVVY